MCELIISSYTIGKPHLMTPRIYLSSPQDPKEAYVE